MRIRTLIGPPLEQEIVRSTVLAIALSNPDPEQRTDRVSAPRRRRPHAPTVTTRIAGP